MYTRNSLHVQRPVQMCVLAQYSSNTVSDTQVSTAEACILVCL